MTNLYIERISDQAVLPYRATELSAGLDVCVCFHEPTVTCFYGKKSQQYRIKDGVLALLPGERAMIPTGLRMAVDPGRCIKIYPRSGLSLKQGLTLINSVAVGDSEYRDEYFILLVNHSKHAQIINHGDRICQIMVEPVLFTPVVELKKLPVARDSRCGGLGSTGVK
jgi:dUTP pyrophosphatase